MSKVCLKKTLREHFSSCVAAHTKTIKAAPETSASTHLTFTHASRHKHVTHHTCSQSSSSKGKLLGYYLTGESYPSAPCWRESFTLPATLATHTPDTCTVNSVGEKKIKKKNTTAVESWRKATVNTFSSHRQLVTPQVAVHLTFPLCGLSVYECVHTPSERACVGLCACPLLLLG